MSNACRSSEKDAIEKAGLFERISEPSPSIRVGGSRRLARSSTIQALVFAECLALIS